MDFTEKFAVLAGAAKYDASCASSGSDGKGMKGGKNFGNAPKAGA